MTSSSSQRARSSRDVLSVLAFLAGPFAWALDELGGYFVEPKVHAGGSKLLMHAITLLAVGLVVAGAVAGRRALRASSAGHGEPDARSGERTRFLALGGLVMMAFFLLVIVAETIPSLLLGARE